MLEKGSIVRSLAGRDKDGLLAVMEITDDAVTVCDGKERPLENPKRKNPRHLADTGFRLPRQPSATRRCEKRWPVSPNASDRTRKDRRRFLLCRNRI